MHGWSENRIGISSSSSNSTVVGLYYFNIIAGRDVKNNET